LLRAIGHQNGGVGDSVETGLAKKLARPGGNITGVSWVTREIITRQLELLKEVVPQASRVALLLDPANPEVVDLAAKHRVPAVYPDEGFVVRLGGLFTYAPDGVEHFRRLAYFVDRVLRGAKPGDLPIERPTSFRLVINAKTAKALGLTIPPSLLLRADQVIDP
jgi:ABC-type uncharacterized transport system substrate-binding protein